MAKSMHPIFADHEPRISSVEKLKFGDKPRGIIVVDAYPGPDEYDAIAGIIPAASAKDVKMILSSASKSNCTAVFAPTTRDPKALQKEFGIKVFKSAKDFFKDDAPGADVNEKKATKLLSALVESTEEDPPGGRFLLCRTKYVAPKGKKSKGPSSTKKKATKAKKSKGPSSTKKKATKAKTKTKKRRVVEDDED